MKTPDPGEKLVHRAVRSLLEQPGPQRAPGSLDARVRETLKRLAPGGRCARFSRRGWGATPLRVACVTAALVGLCFVLELAFGRREGPAMVLAQVKEALDGVRTVVFQHTEEEMLGSPPRLVTEKTRVFVTKGAWRWESDDGTVGITDLKAAKGIILYPAKHKALAYKQLEHSSNPFESFLESIAAMLDRSKTDSGADPSIKLYVHQTYLVEKLREREVDGKKAVGLLCRGGSEATTIWVDPATRLPVRVETVHSPSGSVPGEKLTMHDFEFNRKLEASLFSTEPPAGYEVEVQVQVQEKAPAAGEKTKEAGEGR